MTKPEPTTRPITPATPGAPRWPHADPQAAPLPPTLPDGSPWPRISIVTPSFNQGRYIEETILSVLNQGYPDVEHIVVDAVSNDGTAEVLERYRPRLARVIIEKDNGQSDAINKGFRHATGTILTWLNADDMLAPGALAAAALALWRSKSDLVAGVCELYKDGSLVHRHLTSCSNGPLPLLDLLDLGGCWLRGQFFYQPEVLFTRDIWERAGAHVREDAFYSMDYELWLRFAHAGARLHVIGAPIARFRLHDQQKTAGDYQSELPTVRDAFAHERAITPGTSRSPGRDRLRVALFNDIGYAYGAGIAHRRVGASLAAMGHQVVAVAATGTLPTREDARVTGPEALRALAAIDPDLVVVGNLHGARISPEVLGVIADRYPTIFVLHDLWMLTGRCAYPGPCDAYRSRRGCSSDCTCAPGYPDLAPDLIADAWESKRRVISSASRLILAGDSRFVAHAASGALATDGACTRTLAKPQVTWLKYGFETDALYPRDKALCRELLGLPKDRFLIMSSASSLDDERKGLAHLAAALQRLNLKDATVVCAGRVPDGQEPPIRAMRAMGYMDDPQRLAMLYSACDLFVGPSLEEAFGQVFVEAAACGTPSVGYPVGGVPEAITHGVTGLVADRVHPDALADAIAALYNDPVRRLSIARFAPIHVRSEWSIVSAAHRLVEVLRETGLEDSLDLGRKITIHNTNPTMPEPECLALMEPCWRAVSGFDAWEGPYPELGLPRCRWMLGPVGRFQLNAPEAGMYRLVIRYVNNEPGQILRLRTPNWTSADRPIPLTAPGEKSVIAFPVSLSRGINDLELHAWRWQEGQRQMSLLIKDIRAVRSPALQSRPRAGTAAEAKPTPQPSA